MLASRHHLSIETRMQVLEIATGRAMTQIAGLDSPCDAGRI
jgi:hypothetical protein